MKSKYLFLLLIIFGIISVFDLLRPGLPVTHDGIDHVARIANFYLDLSEGNLIPRWAPNLNWGYGHPILEFLYPFPSYLSSFFYFIGFSFIDSVKIVLGLGIILSGIFMYLWLHQFLSKESAFVGGILYMMAPYRFVDLYVRGDIGENLAFPFMPLSLYFILKLSRKISLVNSVGLSISIALLILSHNAISLIYMPFILFYGIYVGFKNKKYLINFFTFFILGFGLSAFFWIPGLLEAKYTLRNIVTAGGYIDRFVSFEQLVYGPWSYGGTGQFTVQLGLFQWISLIASLFLIIRSIILKKKNYLLPLVLVIYSLAAIFIMFSQSDFIWSRFLILQNFQFPWRFLAITVFTCAVLGSLVFEKISDKFKMISIIIFVLSIIFLSRDYWRANGYLQKDESYFTGIYNSTTDTGESSPIWSIRFMEKRALSPIEVIGGAGKIVQIERKSTEHVYKVDAINKMQVRENTVYFPGWKVFVDGKEVPVEFQSGVNRGVITFFVNPGQHILNIKFSETKLRLIADFISLASLILILSYNVWVPKLWQRFQ